MSYVPPNPYDAGLSRTSSTPQPLGADPNDCIELAGAADVLEAMLRHPRRVIYHLRHGGAVWLTPVLLATALMFVATYGVIVGSFSGGVQWWAAPLKIAGGTAAIALICLPSLYIFACLSGSTVRLGEAAGALSGLLVLLALLLVGFAPVAWLFSQSTESVALMGSLHLGFWLIAAWFGIRFLVTAFRHFNLRSPAGLNVWVVIFVLVSLQMTTALRPLLGTSDTLLPGTKRFFMAHWGECLNGAPAAKH